MQARGIIALLLLAWAVRAEERQEPEPPRSRNPLAHAEEIFGPDSSDTARHGNPGEGSGGNAARSGSRPAGIMTTGGFGPGGLANLSAAPSVYHLFAGRLWETAPNLFFRTVGEITSDFRHAMMMSFELGADWCPGSAMHGPLLGAGAGLAYGLRGDAAGFGLGVGATAGALLFRHSRIRLRLEARVNLLLEEVGGGHPVAYVGRLGLLY